MRIVDVTQWHSPVSGGIRTYLNAKARWAAASGHDHGVVVTRAAVSARIPRGICLHYHAPERTHSVPKSPLRGNRRAGGHNSLTRILLKPNHIVGGYAQLAYFFNYIGPIGNNRDEVTMIRRRTTPVEY